LVYVICLESVTKSIIGIVPFSIPFWYLIKNIPFMFVLIPLILSDNIKNRRALGLAVLADDLILVCPDQNQ
jgi:hypothetical protein